MGRLCGYLGCGSLEDYVVVWVVDHWKIMWLSGLWIIGRLCGCLGCRSLEDYVVVGL